MSVMDEAADNRPALPTAGLAGQVSFRCYWAHEFMATPGWVFPPPVSRPYATLWLIRAGRLRIDDGSGPQTCGPGSLVCWPPGHTRKGQNWSALPVELYTVAFDLHMWGEVDFFHVYRVPAVHRVRDFDTLAEPCRALVAELTSHGEAVTLVAEGWARVLVGRWLDEIEAVGALLPAARVDGRLSTVLAAIEADLAGEWNLQRLAGMMCLSKVRVRELFVRAVGLPPMRYITVHRIAHAQSLLQNTDLTCTEISRRCGFQDPAYFSRIFHRLTGTQPLTYREQARFQRE